MLLSTVKQAARFVVTILALVTLVFFAIKLAPGDASSTLLSEAASPEVTQALRKKLGLDQPLLVQYYHYMSRLLTGDFGMSWRTGAPVTEQIVDAFMHTLLLAVTAMIIATSLGIILGLFSAIRQGRLPDVAGRTGAFIITSIPIFVLNVGALYIFSYIYPIFPTSGSDGWESLVLPAVSLGIANAAVTMRLTRSATLEVLSQDYIRAARARGIPSRAIIFRHLLPSTLVTVVTYFGVQLGLLLGGSVITETVFSWPGLGLMTIDAIKMRDMPVLFASVTLFSICFVFINFIVDCIYPILDPRIARRK